MTQNGPANCPAARFSPLRAMHAPTPEATHLESEVLAQYDAGRYVDAFHLLEKRGGLAALTGPPGRALAGRLATNLGAERYGAAIHLRAWRRTTDPNALGYFVAIAIARLWGPVQALELLDQMPRDELTPQGLSDVASAQAHLFGSLRDFERADAALAEGFKASPERPWLLVVQGELLRMQDRTADAAAAVCEALKQRPLYRPAVQWYANHLVQQNEVDEAHALLVEASKRLQSGSVLLQLARLERELGRYESARSTLEAALAMLPLRDKDRGARETYVGMAATLAYDVGDFDAAVRLGEESGHPFHKVAAENIKQRRTTGRRVVLNVGFTLQHDVTCVPATVSTLSEFWGRKASHLEIADAICYDGTPAHAERAWLERQGFYCQEFTQTWDATTALIDAGIPFSQTLTGYSSGHMQAVIGYDSRRGVIIYRDPAMRHSGEVLGKELIEAMRSSGPRGLVFTPQAQRAKVEALDLPDHALWTRLYELSQSLTEHRRADAVVAYRAMHAEAPRHRLTTHARARIASYDGDLVALAKLTDRLLREFPDDQNQWSVKLSLLRQIGSRAERLAALEGLCDKSNCELVYRHQLIEELLLDPRELPRVDYLLRRCMRANPLDPQTLGLKARRAWLDQDREMAMTLSRYAACVDVRSEERWNTYFASACVLNRSSEALRLLEDRFHRFQKNDGGPACSLVDALDQVMQQQRALRTLETALAARPEDGELLLFAANYQMRLGRMKEAIESLRQAKGKSHPASWLAVAAQFARHENRLEDAYRHLVEALKQSPLNVATHRSAVEVLADWRGAEAAVEHLAKFVKRYPKSINLRALLVEFSSELGAERAEAAARDHLKFHPEDSWCWRELGFKLVEQRRWGEARQACDQADRREPGAMSNRHLSGMIFAGQGDVPSAREEFTKAIRQSVDYGAAIAELMRLCDSRAERQEALAMVLTELKRQVIQGETLQLFRAHAARAYSPSEALAIVTEARAARPDLWTAWHAVVEQLAAMNRLDAALQQAQAAVKRFPLLPTLRAQLAVIYRETGRGDEELNELRRALSINSRNGDILRALAEAYGRRGEVDRQGAILQRACESEPRNVTHRGALAEFLWRQGRRDEAIETIRAAIKQEPLYEWGWNQLAEWASVVGQADLPIETANEIVTLRPNSPEARLQLADLLSRFPERANQCWEAIRETLKLDPRSVDAHELAAVFLATHGRFDEAIAACSPPVFGKRPPLRLQGRAAVIESQRGEIDRAVKRMEKLVAVDSDYYFAWAQLATWLQQQGKPDESLAAARRLVEIAPRAPASWAHVADCLAQQGKQVECREHLKRAVDLDPSYLYAGERLLQLQTDAGDIDDALETLALIGPNLGELDRYAKEARLHALARRKVESLAALRQAILHPAQGDGWLDATLDAMLLAGWAEPVKAALSTAIQQRQANGLAAAALVEVLSREAASSAIEQLCDSLDEESEAWACAVGAYLDALGEAEAHDLLDRFVQGRSRAVRRQTRTWAVVGSALHDSGRLSEAIAWMTDWNHRPDVEPHQLIPLVLALLQRDGASQAVAVVDHALAMPVAPATDALRTLGAAAEFLREDPSAAVSRLAAIAPQNLLPYYEVMYEALRATGQAIADLDRGVGPRDVWSNWKNAVGRLSLGRDRLINLVVAQCRWQLRTQSGNPVSIWLANRQLRRARAARGSTR